MSSRSEIECEASRWLARRESDAWNPVDEVRLANWLDASIAHRVAFLRLQEAWHEAARLRALGAGIPSGEVPARGTWHEADRNGGMRPDAPPGPPDLRNVRINYRRQSDKRRFGWNQRVASALALAGIAIAGILGWQPEEARREILATGLGQVESVTLADGTLVTLSSDSRVEVVLERRLRRVHLIRGEAIFEVAHDSERPFVVAADDARVTAIGTRFSVRHAESDLRVIVTEGRVRLEQQHIGAGATAPVALLSAGNVAFAGDEGVRIESLHAEEAERLLEWRSGYLGFDDLPLAEAVAEFNRFNPRKLELADAEVAQLRVGGNFRWNNVEGFVNLLERGFPVRAERLSGRIVLHSR
ncbi:MAG: histidine kinase [Gammaproteobacteria bacterium]|nr:MAG: histidine kinase [Gammaproteobacteria bacterium]